MSKAYILGGATMNNKGENIVTAIRYIQNFYSEVAQLFTRLDDLMQQKEWTSARGNTTSRECSTDLLKPKMWLPKGNFRLYENERRPNLRKGITICYNHEEINEPLLICGTITYNDIKEAEDWDMWDLWFEDKQQKILNTNYFDFDLDKERLNQKLGKKNCIYAMNLVQISTEEDIKEKIFKKLMEV